MKKKFTEAQIVFALRQAEALKGLASPSNGVSSHIGLLGSIFFDKDPFIS